jgi:predicted ThiF/HesA family dinucleotide-utilizing enzyme
VKVRGEQPQEEEEEEEKRKDDGEVVLLRTDRLRLRVLLNRRRL